MLPLPLLLTTALAALTTALPQPQPQPQQQHPDSYVPCVPSALGCDGNVSQYCNKDGQGWTRIGTCGDRRRF
ncbi:uncharacterized protein GGS25DRAFT_522110 [Hypoxylon fragiforme]|uniref:uncharacterized protein n=1 Tax=Hypoxylon fragiforme TaxID=63214 RepID=UPI0020C6B870|nr:uncharacterized protein GGS25DRAFT_522110 [Hypoxylon fragiforme]KAI2608931.1 hypothetical protein GGS25DRAFT_522110 [Hypoxylon fragiforme]